VLKHIFILLLLCSFAKLNAQEPIRYTTKQGLPTNHVYDIAEDENGFMWFATKQGVVKYDGESFKTFTIKDGLPNNDTWLLETDLQGRLWYFSKSAYQGYIKNDSIYKFSTKEKEVITPRFFYKTKDSLWFYGTSGIQTFSDTTIVNAGFYNNETAKKFNGKINVVQRQYGFIGETGLMPVFNNPETEEYIFLQKTKLLVYDWDFKFKKEILVNFPLENKNAKIQNQGLLYNQIGFYGLEKGILFMDFKTYKAKYISFKELVGVDSIRYFRCFGLKNEIQISIPGHLMIFDYQLNLKNTYDFPENLSAKSYKDSKGNIWLLDLANGISLIPNTQADATYYLNNQKVQKINWINNILFAGVNDVGFFQFNKTENTFKSIFQFAKANGEIYQIKNDKETNTNYFISAANQFTLDKSNSLNEFDIKQKNETNGYIGGLKDLVNFKNKLYVVASNHLYRSNSHQENGQIIVVKSGLLFAETFNNQLFIAGSDGLHLLDNDQIIKPKISNNLLNIPIGSIATTDNFLIVGTDGRGVYLYNEDKIFHLKETDGLSIQRILVENDTLWVATQKGVKKIELNKTDLSTSRIVDSYYEADGLLQNNTNDIYIKDSMLFAASDMGLAKLNIKSEVYKQQPKLYFKTSNDTLQYKNEGRDNITITFALQNYANQEHVTYKYRLLPSQKEWVSTETKTLNFSNLSPKLHTLEVKATDQHNNTSITTQYLNIVPQWWQLWYNKIGFAFIALFGFLLLMNKTKQKIKKNEHEKAQKEKRVVGLELQALRSQMNPHFVHNTLNAIQYFIQRNEVELSENYLSKFSQLIRLFFEYSRRQTITIKEELELLTNYLEIEKLRFEEKLTYTITVCEKIDAEEQHIPSMLLQPIVENAVNHGLFHKKGNGKVCIEFKQLSDAKFQVILKDDGIGINKAKALFKASSKNYQSNSSNVLRERLDLLNQSKEWHIDYKIKDISETKKDKTGTMVTLIFTQLNNQ